MPLNRSSWKESLSGGWLNFFSPTACLFVVIFGDVYLIPKWLLLLGVMTIWFAGLFFLIRVQFARRKQPADIFEAYWRTTFFGFLLLSLVLAVMYFYGKR
jgi:hypothetical protein